MQNPESLVAITAAVVSILSIVGSGVTFVLTSRDRKSKTNEIDASAADKQSASYQRLVESLERRLEAERSEDSELELLKAIHALLLELKEERQKNGKPG